MKLGECTNNNWYINKCMKIEPIKKVDKIENNKGIGYYHNRCYSRKIHEGFEDTKKEKRKGNDFKQKYNEAKDSKLSENEQSEAKNENKNESQSIQAIYNMEAMRIKNSQIYEKKNEKDLTEHEKNYELQMQRAKRAYNKSDKVKDKPKKVEEDNKPKGTKIRTKQEKMEEFKESLKQKPKSDLDIAFEKFEEELAKKKEFDKSIHKKDGKKYVREI